MKQDKKYRFMREPAEIIHKAKFERFFLDVQA